MECLNASHRGVFLLPVGWETHTSPSTGKAPQKIIDEQVLTSADLLVGIFWTRLGTATEDYASGSVEEIEEHVKAGKPAMLYFSSAPVRPDSVEAKQYEALKKFKESLKSRGLYESYGDLNDFREKFYRQLQLKINQDSYFASAADDETSAVTLRTPATPALSREAQILLKEASQDRNGIINRLSHIGGARISTHGRGFVEERDARSLALWDGALKELESCGLIEPMNFKRDGFRVTRDGFAAADKLNP
jgi:hypothetical protein